MAGISDMLLCVFKMLGYRFSLRFKDRKDLKDLKDRRFRKARMPGGEPVGGHGPLQVPGRTKVNVPTA
ncbi:hypothetical protein ACFYY1_28765 [Streptomyces sp. NPDC001890]|uniref:hypothetical protein n=1 Tax=Streptomyces sp. NPDC001890 TaxID=3364620 RepID=UPI0036B284D5